MWSTYKLQTSDFVDWEHGCCPAYYPPNTLLLLLPESNVFRSKERHQNSGEIPYLYNVKIDGGGGVSILKLCFSKHMIYLFIVLEWANPGDIHSHRNRGFKPKFRSKSEQLVLVSTGGRTWRIAPPNLADLPTPMIYYWAHERTQKRFHHLKWRIEACRASARSTWFIYLFF